MCYIQQTYMLGHIQHWKFTTNTYNEFSGTGSVQWRNDMVLLCPSWSCCWPGNYFHLSTKLIFCHWPSHSFVTAFHVNPLHSFINPHGKLLWILWHCFPSYHLLIIFSLLLAMVFSSPLPLLLPSWKRLQSANRHCRRSWTAITQLRMQVSPTNPLPLSSPCCPLWMLLFFSYASSCTLHLCESVTWS